MILRLGIQLPSTKAAFYISIIVWIFWGPIEFTAAALKGTSLSEVMEGLQVASGSYSGIWCQYLMRRSRLLLVEATGDLARCSYVLEKNGDPSTKNNLQRTARRKLYQVYFYFVYGIATVFGALATFITMRTHWTEAIIDLGAQAGVQLTVVMLKALMLPLQTVLLFSVLITYYSALPLFFILYGSTAELHRGIAVGIKNGHCTEGWAALQSHLIAVTAKVRVAVADVIPHMLVVGIVLPLFCTVDVLTNGLKAGYFAMCTAPLLFTILVASFEAGENVSASLEARHLCHYFLLTSRSNSGD
ncbi:uncharacterized protein LOC117640439 [Thrips palmi]|uniref:Uncharacterized protein LOC117640439 n=1 Tax=Thrips palmi TaxID=161013 RepID=A0A6P8Y070_THRPL|nr:uncharacterized protein LOC117640439 [Thrips palmi]